MLKRPNRLKATRDFSHIYKRGRQVSTPFLRLTYLPANQNHTRFGFVVSKKNAGKIALRNRMKRRLREQTRALLANLPPGFDIIVQARDTLSTLSSAQVREQLEIIFKRVRLWREQ